MKKIKYMFLGALMTVMVAPAMAQDVNPTTAQVSEILKNAPSPKDATKQVAAFAKQYKKDAKAISAIGRAYLAVKDLDNATKYANDAIKAGAKVADGYVLLGDIAVLKDDGGEASSWYEQAIYADPKDPEGYRKYAITNSKTSPTTAVQKLEELRAQRPDYPVDLIAADIYSRAGNFDQAISYYDKVDKGAMKDYELTDYALNLFLNQNYEKALTVSLYGNNKFPRYGALNRLSMYNYVNLNKFEEGLVYAERLFNESDSVTINVMDLQSYGLALSKQKMYDKSIETYMKILDLEDASADAKNEVYKNVSDAYKSKGDYAKAAENYDKYLKGVKAPSAFVVASLAAIYKSEAVDENTAPEQKTVAFAKADAVYADMVEQFPTVADYATQQRAQLALLEDPEGKDGKALPHYEKLIEIVNAKAEKGAPETARLKEAYNFLTVYFLKVANNVDKAKENAAKLQEIDPDNEIAKIVLELQTKK